MKKMTTSPQQKKKKGKEKRREGKGEEGKRKERTEGHDCLSMWQKKTTNEENKESVVRGRRSRMRRTRILREEIVLRQRE